MAHKHKCTSEKAKDTNKNPGGLKNLLLRRPKRVPSLSSYHEAVCEMGGGGAGLEGLLGQGGQRPLVRGAQGQRGASRGRYGAAGAVVVVAVLPLSERQRDGVCGGHRGRVTAEFLIAHHFLFTFCKDCSYCSMHTIGHTTGDLTD